MFKPTFPCDTHAPAGQGRRHSVSRVHPRTSLLPRGVLLAVVLATPLPAFTTDLSSVPLPTYSIGTAVDIKPNILMVLDDSGSMSSDYLPDWAIDTPPNYKPSSYDNSPPLAVPYLNRNASFNGIAYNPAITYLPPIGFNANGTKNTTTYPSMIGQTAATGADSSTKPNWKAVKDDGFGVQSADTSNLVDNAFFYTTIPGEFCDASGLTSCRTTASASGNYAYPAPLRWCNSAALTTCRALQDSTYRYPRMPAPRVATITFSNASNAVVTGITVDGLQIVSGSTSSGSDSSTVASRVAAKVNDCSNTIAGNCTTVGYVASASGGTLTLLAPGTTSGAPTVTKTGTLNSATGAFAQAAIPLAPYLASGGSVSSAAVPGENLRTAITSTITRYPYPGASTKAATRTDCADTTCTYAEEMTNYANWWAYYRTRMQMMKTGTSRAFSVLDTDTNIAAGTTRYRVGYLTINNNNTNDFVNITDFNTAQKVTWFSKLFNAKPGNRTPLREALSKAGRLYAGKYNGKSLHGTEVIEPLEYSCQKNFTILSTDGFWNGTAGVKLDGSTAIGNQDGTLPRPYNDGGSAQAQARTSQLQQKTGQQSAERGTLQKQTSQLQIMTSQLKKRIGTQQTRTGDLQARTLTQEKRTGPLQSRTGNMQSRTKTVQYRTSSDSGATWSNWETGACTPDSSGTKRMECQTFIGLWTPASSCTAGTSGGITTECQGSWGNWADANSCTAGTSGGVSTECRVNWGNWGSASSCAAVTSGATQTDCRITTSAWKNTGSCTPGTSGAVTTECQVNWGSWSNTNSCSVVSSGGARVDCQSPGTTGTTPVPALPISMALTRRIARTSTPRVGTDTGSCKAGTSGSGLVTSCQSQVTSPFSNAVTVFRDVARRQRNEHAVPVRIRGQGSHRDLHSSLRRRQLCERHRLRELRDHRELDLRLNLHRHHHARRQREHHILPIRRLVELVQRRLLHACVAIDRAQLHSGACTCNARLSAQVEPPIPWPMWPPTNTAPTCEALPPPGSMKPAPGKGPIISPAATENNLCTDNVPSYGRDTNSKQHMTTHTLGLGVQGMMVYSPYQNNLTGQRVYTPDYWSQPSGDFYAVANGTAANPASGICPWMATGNCTWPIPASDSIANIDDLWHAAVNGRGSYFSATDPQSLSDGLQAVLGQIVNTPATGDRGGGCQQQPQRHKQ